MKVDIFDQRGSSIIDKKKITHLIRRALQEERFVLNNLNVIIVDNEYMKRLNRTFFKKNRPTNVISFHMDEVSEIYVSHEQVRNIEELHYCIIHGLLHIVGYDHKSKRDDEIMAKRCFKYLEYAS